MATLPNWLVPARPAPLYGQGLGLGLQAAQQQQQFALRQQQMAQEAAYRQAQMAADAERQALNQEVAQQEIGLRQQGIGLTAQELALRRAVDQSKMDEALNRYRAQQEYRQRVAAGEPAEQVLAEMGPMLGSDSAYAALIREQSRPSEQEMPMGPVQGQPLLTPEGKPVPGVTMYRGSAGNMLPFRNAPEVAQMTEEERRKEVREIREAMNKLYESNLKLFEDQPDPTWSASRKAQWQYGKATIRTYQDQLRALEGGQPMPPRGEAGISIGGEGGFPPPGPSPAGPLRLGRVSIGGSPAASAPGWPAQEEAAAGEKLPDKKTDLVKGTIYNTKYGPLEWNGTKLVKPTQ